MTKIVYNACVGGFGLSARAIKRLAELQGRPCYFFDVRLNKPYEPLDVDSADSAFMFSAFDIPNPNELFPPGDDWYSMTIEQRTERNDLYKKHHIEVPDDRTNPLLVQVVEELREVANGRHAQLRIQELAPGTKFIIDEYDGSESVKTPDEFEWMTA